MFQSLAPPPLVGPGDGSLPALWALGSRLRAWDGRLLLMCFENWRGFKARMHFVRDCYRHVQLCP
eukprot:8220344-Karenia_brevis.AAC.1